MEEKLKKRLRDLLLEKSIKYSDTPVFKLASGRMSDFYVDCRKVTHNAEGKYLIGNMIFDLLRDITVDAIGGLTIGADPIASAVAYTAFLNKKRINSFVIRKEQGARPEKTRGGRCAGGRPGGDRRRCYNHRRLYDTRH